jgi:membrane protein
LHFAYSMSRLGRNLGLFKTAVTGWNDDNVSMMSGSLAYSTVFSIAPLLIIAIAIAGLVFGEEASQGAIFNSISSLMGNDGAHAIEALVQSSASKPKAGILATLIGSVTLLIGASSAFSQLQQALNLIWKVRLKPTQGITGMIRQRLLTFSMVLVIAFLLLVSLMMTAAISALSGYLGSHLPGGEVFWQAMNSLVSFLVTSFLFAAIFKILPDVKLQWRDVWIGGAVTALLFTVGKFFIGLYLGHSSFTSSYGAVGSLVIFLVWVYFSSAILFYGAEFTRAYVELKGKPVRPVKEAELISMQVVPSQFQSRKIVK